MTLDILYELLLWLGVNKLDLLERIGDYSSLLSFLSVMILDVTYLSLSLNLDWALL